MRDEILSDLPCNHICLMASYAMASWRTGARIMRREDARDILMKICACHLGDKEIQKISNDLRKLEKNIALNAFLSAHTRSDLGQLLWVAFGPDDAEIDVLPARYESDKSAQSSDARRAWATEILHPFLECCGFSNPGKITGF